tara:strand:- start:42911 stop:44653 length:1743 start_codon:yes stop_codon:yes gene_type:complete
MMDYSQALERASEYLGKREIVEVLSYDKKRKLELPVHLDVWEITTEVINEQNDLLEISLHLVFLSDYPLSFPKVQLSKEDFDKLKYIPHLQVDRIICVFQNNSEPLIDAPELVVDEAINRAKTIIENGLKGINENEYLDEFESYWDAPYSKKDMVNNSYLLMIEKPIEERFYLISLDKPISSYNNIIHQNEKNAQHFKSYLEEKNINFTETTGLIVPNLDILLKPPFNFSNKVIFDNIQTSNKDFFRTYISKINDKTFPKLFLFPKDINSEIRYFGWEHSLPNLNRKGFRKKSLNNFKVLSTFQSAEKIKRVSPQVYSNQRMVKRTSGEQNIKKAQKFVIAGVGSIGSNLIHFLNSQPNSEFKLIDNDKLKLENIGRHYLGFNHLNSFKTTALKDFLLSNSPIQKVETKEESIVHLIKNDPAFVNESDYLFVAIGESNIETWIANAIENKTITTPTFFIWVEPYLLGGHCIFINPKNNVYQTLFDDKGLFKFNIIKDYSNELLTLKEAGCQSNYTPYSSNNIQIYLGALFLEISKVISLNDPNSRSYTWIGDKGISTDMSIELSDYSSGFDSNTLIENEL